MDVSRLSLDDPNVDSAASPPLPRISALRDFPNVDHNELDMRTLELDEFKSALVSNEEPSWPSLLHHITYADKRLKKVPIYLCEIYLQCSPALMDILKEAWKERKFEEVRKLGILWPSLSGLAKRVYDMKCEIHDEHIERIPVNDDTTTTPSPTKLHVVVSLIRHAESLANSTGTWVDDADNTLSAYGRKEAAALGKRWANVRIDHLYSSTMPRALSTAYGIHVLNANCPQIEQSWKITERYIGGTAENYSRRGRHQEARRALTDTSDGSFNRQYRPSGGGESLCDVSERARKFMENDILDRFGICSSVQVSKSWEVDELITGEETPEDLELLEMRGRVTPETLPEGIPHVVVVSHNVFLCELYEGLLFWNKDHEFTQKHWLNASWSRHYLCYDMETGSLEVSDMY